MEGPGFIIINLNLNGVPDVGRSVIIEPNIEQVVKTIPPRGILPAYSRIGPEARTKEMKNIYKTLLGYQQ